MACCETRLDFSCLMWLWIASLQSQEEYWEAYMERFNRTREEWEKLYWDGVPRAPDQDPVAKRPIDHYQVLGLRKYVLLHYIPFI